MDNISFFFKGTLNRVPFLIILSCEHNTERNMAKITREGWLTYAVWKLDEHLFNNELEAKAKGFQVSCAKTPGQKHYDFVLPYQGEDVDLNDFFPITLSVDYTTQDPIELMTYLAYAMLKAFKDNPKGKRLKELCKTFYFDAPYSAPNPSAYAKDMISDAYKDVVNTMGEWPGKAIVIKPKEPKEKKSNKVVFFCPNCGLELSATKKMMKDKNGYPTCVCGTKMGIAADENTEENPGETK